MATLTVWKFENPDGAERALVTLERLQEDGLITVEDAAIVSWASDKKKPKTRDLSGTTGAGALGGAFWGFLFGLIFFIPFLGMALGAAAGALAGSMADVGIDKDFIERVRGEVTPGTSALFVLTSGAVMDRVHDAFAAHAPTLIQSNLSEDEENRLREAFAA